MADPDPSAEEKIVLGAIAAIEADGFQNVTTRSIARHAGVNSAAINYYFRSKDRLMERVRAQTLNNAFGDLDEFFPDGPLDSLQPVKGYYHAILQGMIDYPQICRIHVMGPIVNQVYDDPAGQRLNEFLAVLFRKLSPMCRPDGHDRLRRALVLVQSGVMMFGLSPDAYGPFLGAKSLPQDTLKSFVDQLVDDLIKPCLR